MCPKEDRTRPSTYTCLTSYVEVTNGVELDATHASNGSSRTELGGGDQMLGLPSI
jgi:hypothetical protein